MYIISINGQNSRELTVKRRMVNVKVKFIL